MQPVQTGCNWFKQHNYSSNYMQTFYPLLAVVKYATIQTGLYIFQEVTMSEETFDPTLADAVRLRVNKLRTERGLSMQEFARAAHVSYATALSYDRDTLRYFRRDVLASIAQALQCNVVDLFEPVAVLETVTMQEAVN